MLIFSKLIDKYWRQAFRKPGAQARDPETEYFLPPSSMYRIVRQRVRAPCLSDGVSGLIEFDGKFGGSKQDYGDTSNTKNSTGSWEYRALKNRNAADGRSVGNSRPRPHWQLGAPDLGDVFSVGSHRAFAPGIPRFHGAFRERQSAHGFSEKGIHSLVRHF